MAEIVIDISRLHKASLKRGVGFYSKNLFESLKDLDDGNQYILKKSLKERIRADIIHFPYFDLFFLTLPLVRNQPVVVTIHDLTPLKFPKHFSPGLRGKIKWQIQKKLAKRVSAIITDSKNSKKDIIKIIGCPSEKIFSIYLASGKEFKEIKSPISLGRIKAEYELSENFILYVGDLNWNKNIEGLVRAFKKCKIKNLKLIFAGESFKNENLVELRGLKSLIDKLDLKDKVRLLGFVPTRDLVAIYNLATLYVQPSFYEGFGLPVLEAMACGCPVLSSNKASLPEVGENAVEYFDPCKKGDLERKLGYLINNFNKLKYLKEKGLEQVKKFSWKKTALETRKVYEKVLSKD